jgi:hypothetical protein
MTSYYQVLLCVYLSSPEFRLSVSLFILFPKTITHIHFKLEILIEYQGKNFILKETANTWKNMHSMKCTVNTKIDRQSWSDSKWEVFWAILKFGI